MPLISSIRTYPIKSTSPVLHRRQKLYHDGFYLDREWVVIDKNNSSLTARTYPKLLKVSTKLKQDSVEVYIDRSSIGQLDLKYANEGDKIEIKIHSYIAYGHRVHTPLEQHISDFLGAKIRLARVLRNIKRNVLSKHGGQSGDTVGFADQAPILLLSEASLKDLNSRMETSIEMDRFRPNLVISDCLPYEEDSWNHIRIGSTTLRVIQSCERCILTTIDPYTLKKDVLSEPLKTLKTYRIGPRGGCIMGVHAVPTTSGDIQLGDKVEFINHTSQR